MCLEENYLAKRTLIRKPIANAVNEKQTPTGVEQRDVNVDRKENASAFGAL